MKYVNLFILNAIMENIDVSQVLTEEQIDFVEKASERLNDFDEADLKYFMESLADKVKELYKSVEQHFD